MVNVRDAAWVSGGHFADACVIEGDAVPFEQIGYTIAVLQPGQPSALYHREGNQEDFLVLAGECLLLIEGEERPLKAWDFVHCPPGTEHIFVGAGDGRAWSSWPVPAASRRTRTSTCARTSRCATARAWRPRRILGRGVRAVPALAAGPPASWHGLPWALR